MSRIRETPNQCPVRVLEYRLDCGRDVFVEECYIGLSALGFLAGRKEAFRTEVIKNLPERARVQFPGNYGLLIKPVPDAELPTYTFMVALSCDQPVCDLSSDFSALILCWLSDDIGTPLPELIDREIPSIEWDKYAVDGWS
jgi:hypothetical protein